MRLEDVPVRQYADFRLAVRLFPNRSQNTQYKRQKTGIQGLHPTEVGRRRKRLHISDGKTIALEA